MESYSLFLAVRYKSTIAKIKRNKPDLLLPLEIGAAKILRNPELGKPLRHGLRNRRRLHIASSFVLMYEVTATEVRLLDFDHHNKIYKKYR